MNAPGTLPRLTLVLGGARSGKSSFAERLVHQAGAPLRYIATATPMDEEMQERIARHQADRQGVDWITVETPHDLAGEVTRLGPPAKAALIDCATLWLSNRLLAGADLDLECAELVEALAASPLPITVVSNEVGCGIVPANALSRSFRDAQGRLNQRIAERAGLVVMVMAGLPLVLKGSLPATLDPSHSTS